MGDKQKAIGYYEQALAIDRKVSGEEHPDVAIGLNNLGGAWKSPGEYQKAIEYFEQSLSISALEMEPGNSNTLLAGIGRCSSSRTASVSGWRSAC